MLIVVSKAKAYAKEKHGMRLSSEVLDVLTQRVATLIDLAAAKAEAGRRGTVKARDLEG